MSGKSFIPMIWGADATDHPWHSDISDPVAEHYHTVLGFNEPDRPTLRMRGRGADLTPEEAAAAWIEIQTLYPDKVAVKSMCYVYLHDIQYPSISSFPGPGEPRSRWRPQHSLV